MSKCFLSAVVFTTLLGLVQVPNSNAGVILGQEFFFFSDYFQEPQTVPLSNAEISEFYELSFDYTDGDGVFHMENIEFLTVKDFKLIAADNSTIDLELDPVTFTSNFRIGNTISSTPAFNFDKANSGAQTDVFMRSDFQERSHADFFSGNEILFASSAILAKPNNLPAGFVPVKLGFNLIWELDDAEGFSPQDDLQVTFSQLSNSTVPEPTSLACWSIGLGALGLTRRRRRQKRSPESVAA